LNAVWLSNRTKLLPVTSAGARKLVVKINKTTINLQLTAYTLTIAGSGNVYYKGFPTRNLELNESGEVAMPSPLLKSLN